MHTSILKDVTFDYLKRLKTKKVYRMQASNMSTKLQALETSCTSRQSDKIPRY